MGRVNAAKPEPQPVAETLISQCRGPGSIPSQGTRFHMPQLQMVQPLLRPGPAKSIRTGEGSRNMGEPGVTPGRAAQAGVAVAWMRWEPSDRLAAPDRWGQGGEGLAPRTPVDRALPLHTQGQQLWPHRGTHAREEPSEPRAHTLGVTQDSLTRPSSPPPASALPPISCREAPSLTRWPQARCRGPWGCPAGPWPPLSCAGLTASTPPAGPPFGDTHLIG